MRVLFDTNILFSALVFPKGQVAKLVERCTFEHDIVIPSYVIAELKTVLSKKLPSLLPVVDVFLEKLCFQLAYTPDKIKPDLFHIRDPKDYPILYTAIVENVDVIISGDADFKDTDVTHPEILTPAEFIKKY